MWYPMFRILHPPLSGDHGLPWELWSPLFQYVLPPQSLPLAARKGSWQSATDAIDLRRVEPMLRMLWELQPNQTPYKHGHFIRDGRRQTPAKANVPVPYLLRLPFHLASGTKAFDEAYLSTSLSRWWDLLSLPTIERPQQTLMRYVLATWLFLKQVTMDDLLEFEAEAAGRL